MYQGPKISSVGILFKQNPRAQSSPGKQLQSGWNFARVRRFAEQPWKFISRFSGEAGMAEVILNPEQEAEAQRLAALIGKKAEEEALAMMRLMVSKPDAQLLGATEFEIRDRAHRLAAHAIETALNERKKGGTKARP